eukprot:2220777-Lingulodinium_polyedra.AAC.1
MSRPPLRVSASRPTLVSASICASASRPQMLLTAMLSAMSSSLGSRASGAFAVAGGRKALNGGPRNGDSASRWQL